MASVLHNLTVDKVRQSVISASYVTTPFGRRRLVYADHTASGRPLEVVEKYLESEVLPWYANTHSEMSYNGRLCTQMRETARKVIADAFGADSSYAVIFTGQGTTSAINKLVDALGIKIPYALNRAYNLVSRIPENERPVILVGPWEHHSNELPWRESIGTVVEVELGDDGSFDLQKLDQALNAYRGRPLIASFSAASNVTGVLAPLEEIAKRVKARGGLVFFDCAAVAPHHCPRLDKIGADGLFFSGHKFMGGPGSPGVLIAKRSLFAEVPTQPGGGTVTCVMSTKHWYSQSVEAREEAGTPDIIGAIRLGLAFTVRDQIGCDRIGKIEKALRDRAVAELSKEPNLRILGNSSLPSMPIISFEVMAPSSTRGKKLHHNFVVALLNDLFGIQARSGCMCAGPYMVRLLGACPTEGCTGEAPEIQRPGFARISFNYLTTEEECEYVIRAIQFVAREGYRFVSRYVYDKASGGWIYTGPKPVPSVRVPTLTETMVTAKKLANERRPASQGDEGMVCWFMTPSEG